MTHNNERPVGDCYFCGSNVMESEDSGRKTATGAPAHTWCVDKAEDYANDAETPDSIDAMNHTGGNHNA